LAWGNGSPLPPSCSTALPLPDEVERWSLTTLREKVVKIGAKVISHARYTVFQMAEVAVPRDPGLAHPSSGDPGWRET